MLSLLLLTVDLTSATPPPLMTVHRSNLLPTLDSKGGVLNAHETQIIRDEASGIFYLYGMKYALCRSGATHGSGCAKNRTQCDFRDDHNVSVYTSTSLASGSWEWQADLLPATAPTASYFRGKVLRRNASWYVLWVFGGSNLVVATSTSPIGPFKLHHVAPSNQALLHKTGDFSFWIDDHTSIAYVIYNANMKGMMVEQLSADYTSALGRRNATQYSSGIFGDAKTEAPVLFRRKDIVYALFDHTCCVCAYGSGAQVHVSASALGPFVMRGQIGRDGKGDPVAHAQQAWVMRLPTVATGGGGDVYSYIWIGDRWGSADDGLHGHDYSYWSELVFTADGNITHMAWVDEVNLTMVLSDIQHR